MYVRNLESFQRKEMIVKFDHLEHSNDMVPLLILMPGTCVSPPFHAPFISIHHAICVIVFFFPVLRSVNLACSTSHRRAWEQMTAVMMVWLSWTTLMLPSHQVIIPSPRTCRCTCVGLYRFY